MNFSHISLIFSEICFSGLSIKTSYNVYSISLLIFWQLVLLFSERSILKFPVSMLILQNHTIMSGIQPPLYLTRPLSLKSTSLGLIWDPCYIWEARPYRPPPWLPQRKLQTLPHTGIVSIPKVNVQLLEQCWQFLFCVYFINIKCLWIEITSAVFCPQIEFEPLP